MHFNRYTIIFILLFLLACTGEKGRFDVEPGRLEDEVEIKRYGKALFEIDQENLPAALEEMQPEFRIFLGSPADIANPVNLRRLEAFVSDTLLRAVYEDCLEQFPDLYGLEKSLNNAFRYYRYYIPENPVPEVYTYVSGFDYEHKVQFYNNNLLIALDMYLGEDYPRYKQLGLPGYVLENFHKKYIASDCMYAMAGSFVNLRQTGEDLLDRMILEGKLLWFVRAMIPDIPVETLYKYNKEQLAWAQKNEGLVWAFIIENNLLYNPDPLVRQKFLAGNPFTSYFGQDSPPRLGAFIGYRMVEQYMERNRDVTLQELLQTYDAAEVLKGSRYKPEL